VTELVLDAFAGIEMIARTVTGSQLAALNITTREMVPGGFIEVMP